MIRIIINLLLWQVLLNEDTFPKESDISEIQEGSREMTNYNDNVEEISEDDDDARLFEQLFYCSIHNCL